MRSQIPWSKEESTHLPWHEGKAEASKIGAREFQYTALTEYRASFKLFQRVSNLVL